MIGYKIVALEGAKPLRKITEISKPGWYCWVPADSSRRPRFVEVAADDMHGGIPDVPAYAGTYIGPIEVPHER